MQRCELKNTQTTANISVIHLNYRPLKISSSLWILFIFNKIFCLSLCQSACSVNVASAITHLVTVCVCMNTHTVFKIIMNPDCKPVIVCKQPEYCDILQELDCVYEPKTGLCVCFIH